ncbi:sensor histidine kinase [Thermus tengchongensis]|uniref:sensor histidine kinase n=1 Tax=Thermus tengchongensis TaxID=1214928 RepID=UPI0005701944|nr:HAMP domain-containing sensor histidine kinase [Thermus tengchongensis]
MSLRTRLALISAFLALVGLGFGLWFSSLLLTRLVLAEVDHTLRLQANVLLEAALAQPDRLVPPEVEQEVLGGEFPAAAWLFEGGVLLWSGGLSSSPRMLANVEVGKPLSLGGWRAYAAQRGEYRLVVAQPLGVVDRLALLYLRLGLPLVLLVGLATGALAYALVGLSLAPLRRLAEGALRFQVVEPPDGRDEVAQLAQAFARLLATLKEERERERAFLALASHELRTPIAAFRVGLERLLKAPAPDRETLRRLKVQAERLEALAENLLALSRAQAQDLRLLEVDLPEVAGLAFDRFQPLAVAKGRELVLEAQPARAVADPRLLERVLNNLVHNALLHGQGTVYVRTGMVGGRAYLEVKDEGPGPSPRAREGLGLRVVRQVAEALGADLHLAREDGFLIRLLFRPPSATSPSMNPGA